MYYGPVADQTGSHLFLGADDLTEYDPNLLSDPRWPCGKHKRVLIFASYMVRAPGTGSGHLRE